MLLHGLNGVGDAGAKEEEVRPIYDRASGQNPGAFRNYPFEAYIKWLIDTAQLVTRKNDRLVITDKISPR